MSPGRRPGPPGPGGRGLERAPAVRRLVRLASSRCHDLCCYGSLLVMSPQVVAAVIAAGVGLLTVGRADFGGPPHTQPGHSERRSKREGKHLDRTLAEQRNPPAGGPE